MRASCFQCRASKSRIGVDRVDLDHIDRSTVHWVDLIFLSTRTDIEKKTRRHRRHSALLIKEANARVLVDCGADWAGRIEALRPTAIVVTHGHPDHAWGLANGAP